jgi:hypothetical protein
MPSSVAHHKPGHQPPGESAEFHFHRMDKLKSWAKRVTSNKSFGLLAEQHKEWETTKPVWH